MYEFLLKLDGREYSIDLSEPLSIAIPLKFNGAQPNAYGVAKAAAKPCEAGSLVGDTRRGGSCNFEEYRFIPHCNGTHTECVGHLSHSRISIEECLQDAFITASLISVSPEKATESRENYGVELDENDLLITRKAIESELENLRFQIPNFKFEALVIRTLPNSESKLSAKYTEEIPPFFTTEAMLFLREKGVRHLLCDLPSIDRIYDKGRLSNHRIFWNVEPGSFQLTAESLTRQTITELIYASDEIADGNYLLNLQIAPFATDASPSRPILFRLQA